MDDWKLRMGKMEKAQNETKVALDSTLEMIRELTKALNNGLKIKTPPTPTEPTERAKGSNPKEKENEEPRSPWSRGTRSGTPCHNAPTLMANE